jgi:uncharacterized coiled-coil protein SlyX
VDLDFRAAIWIRSGMKRLQRLEFIFLYERFLQRNNELNRAVVERRSEEEIDFLQKQVDDLVERMRDKRSAVNPAAFVHAQ